MTTLSPLAMPRAASPAARRRSRGAELGVGPRGAVALAGDPHQQGCVGLGLGPVREEPGDVLAGELELGHHVGVHADLPLVDCPASPSDAGAQSWPRRAAGRYGRIGAGPDALPIVEPRIRRCA